MKKGYLISLLFVIIPISLFAEELTPEKDTELAQVLSQLIIVHDPIYFKEQDYIVRLYGVESSSHCAAAQHCRSLVELIIVTTEPDDEGAVSNLYRLPKKHEWTVIKWEHLKNGKQGIYLKAKIYENNRPDSKSTEENYVLITTWLNAEIKTL